MNIETVSGLKLKQLQYEITGWKRALVFMMDENIHLKSRLSEILRNRLHKQFLVQAEGFQNNFLQHDDLIGLLRNDIAAFEKLLNRADFEGQNLDGHLNAIRNNVRLAQTQFDLLRGEFNSFLQANM